MKNDNLNNLFEKGKHVKLTEAEKIEVRSQLYAFMKMHPVRERNSWNFGQFLGPILRPIPIVIGLLFLFILGGGVSFAAQGALPGDLLYPVKIHVNEAVKGALVVSPKAKQEWEVEKVERRLVEAEKLAKYDRLDNQTNSELQSRIQESVQKLDEVALKSENQGNGIAASFVQTDLQAVFDAHEKVLEALAPQKSETASEVGQLKETVQEKAKTHHARLEEAHEKIKTEDKHKLEHEASLRLHEAEQKIEEARKAAEASGIQTTALPHTEAAQQLQDAQQHLEQGKSSQESREFLDALNSSQEAQRAAKESESLLRAQREVQIEILKENSHEGKGEGGSQKEQGEKDQGGKGNKGK